MSILKIHSRSGPDSKLHLEIPVGEPDKEFEVEVVVRAKTDGVDLPPSYFDLIGSIDDDTFQVHPQPPVQKPIELE